MNMTLLQSIRGTHDIKGIDVMLHNYIIDVAYKTAENYGYEEIKTPIFEHSEVFYRNLGESSDIVTKETYTFMDRDKTSITLRPEFTAAIVRSVLSSSMIHNIPLKLFSAGPLFRHERPQKCRYRQFHQINFEYFSAKTPNSDAETLALASQIITNLGIDDITLEINTLGDAISRTHYKNALQEYFMSYKNILSSDSIKRLEKNPLRILDSKDAGDRKIIANAPSMIDFLTNQSKEYYYQLLDTLEDLGIPYKENPFIVRGMDYYTHTVFEFTTDLLGSQGTVLAGGRYDTLIEMMGGPSTPAIGFASGIERLAELMKLQPLPISLKKTFYFISIGEEVQKSANIILNTIRNKGFKVISEYGGNISKQFKKANTINAVAVIIFGEEEYQNQHIKVKDMHSGLEEIIPITMLYEYLNRF